MKDKLLLKCGGPELVDVKAIELYQIGGESFHQNSTTLAGKTTVDGQHKIESIISQAIHDTSKGLITLFNEMSLIRIPEMLFWRRPAYMQKGIIKL